jgi:hypothetical protein
MVIFFKDIESHVPDLFTTPTTARAARIHAPLPDDIKDKPWLVFIWHDDPIQNYIMDCGGVYVYT